MAEDLLLAGDIGGTKTLLRLARAGSADAVLERRFETGAYPNLTSMLQVFLAGQPAPVAACFAIAAPVSGRCVRLTNREFWIDADDVERACGIEVVRIINDFVGVAHGIDVLGPADTVTLQAGRPLAGAPRAVLGAGTGLGEAILLQRAGGETEVLASEGGHVDFAPQDEEQVMLWREFAARHGHVSYERVLCGDGLVAIYAWLARRAGAPSLLTGTEPSEAAARVSVAGLSGDDPQAARALDLFVRIYGQQAGNLALTALAQGGVFVAGGIAPKILPRIRAGGFMEGFLAKGRYRDWLAQVPVHVVTHPNVGLLGALRVAAAAASPRSST